MQAQFEQPTALERAMNRLVGSFVRIGVSAAHNRVLEVRGRKSGRIYSTPVNLLEFQGKQWLVAPRGTTQWVRNAQASHEVGLARGRKRQRYSLRPVPESERAPVLHAYLNRYHPTVKRYFDVDRHAPLEAFAAVADRYPVFELTPVRG